MRSRRSWRHLLDIAATRKIRGVGKVDEVDDSKNDLQKGKSKEGSSDRVGKPKLDE